MSEPGWESSEATTYRLKVEGGWLYSNHWNGASGLTYVPDPQHWIDLLHATLLNARAQIRHQEGA